MARNTYENDEILEDKFDAKQLKRLGGYIRPYTGKMLLVLFLMLSSSGLTMFIPKFLQIEMDTYIPNGDIHGIVILTLIAAVIVVYAVVSLRIKVTLTTQVGQDIIHQIREDLFAHLQELPFSYYDDRPHGKIQVRVVNYVNNLSDLLSNGILNTITDLCNLIFILIFMLSMSVKLTLVCMCGLPVLILYIVFLKKKQRYAWQVQSNKQSNLNAYISESINGIRVTQAFVREEENTNIFNRLSMSYRKAWMRAVIYNFAMGPMVDLISTITTAFIYVIGINCIINGGLDGVTTGKLIAFTAYISRFWQPINTIANFYNSVLTAVSYLERIFETMDEPVTVKDAKDAVEMPKIRGEVTFDHVNFSYDASKQILNDVSFTVKPGESVALVGPTGAGKSTIVNLISRFYNVNGGRVLIDGQDISQVTIHSLREQMGIMMQDSFIFSGDIEDNIRYGKLDATHEEIVKASRTVCADEFISKMPDRYQTEVRERGSMLSQGQKQLISFARTLLSDPAILILDEATSSIDVQTEKALQTGLNAMLKGRTSFIIAHRLSTIRNCDKIMYIDNGGIMESGTHDELMAKKGHYYKLYTAQLDEVQKAG